MQSSTEDTVYHVETEVLTVGLIVPDILNVSDTKSALETEPLYSHAHCT